MKSNQLVLMSILSIMLLSLSSCEAIGSIFKAGVWTGIIAIVLVVALILYLIGRSKK